MSGLIRPDPSLYNSDLAPVVPGARTWTAYNYATLWISMSVCIPTYMLASGLIGGLWDPLPCTRASVVRHPRRKYRGHPPPALYGSLDGIAFPALADSGASVWLCFGAFWALNVFVVWKGLDFIRLVENACAPFLLVMGAVTLWWMVRLAGGMGPVLSSPGKFRSGLEFWRFFVPSLTAMVGSWATVAVNIPDFTRYARSQRAQVWGQALALPTTMTLFAFIGVAVTSASVLIFGEAIWDPIALISRLGRPVVALLALLVLATATLSTNIAANIVPPANDFANINPRRISFRTGVLGTGIIGVLMMPWKLLGSANTYIFVWLVGYSSLLGPLAGIIITDYIVLRRRKLDVDGLYSVTGPYTYAKGVNWRAVCSLAAGVLIALSGFVIPPLRWLYDYAWFVGRRVRRPLLRLNAAGVSAPSGACQTSSQYMIRCGPMHATRAGGQQSSGYYGLSAFR